MKCDSVVKQCVLFEENNDGQTLKKVFLMEFKEDSSVTRPNAPQ